MHQDGKALYDKLAILSLKTENGLTGEVIQDVVTFPTEKMARIQWSNGFAEWHVNYQPGADAVISGNGFEDPKINLIQKTRADEFRLEIEHLEKILSGKVTESPISLQRGLDTMMIIAAAFRAATDNRTVNIDWSVGYISDALQ